MSRYRRLFTLVLVLFLLGALAMAAQARTTTVYQLRTSLVSSIVGGIALQGGAYRLSGIAGQPVIGDSSADSSYSVDAGYSELSAPPPDPDASQVFLPFIQR